MIKLGDIYNEVSKSNVYEYGCVMLYLSVDPDFWNNLQGYINDKDVFHGTEDDPGYGREDEPHVTILYGIHSDVSDDDVEKLISTITKPRLSITKIGIFENGDRGFDVVKFEINSEDLNGLNKMFKQLPHTNNYPTYNPHITIAYVKSGYGQSYVDSIKCGDTSGIKSGDIVYSKPDGSKKFYKIEK